ncbi:MAG TPA: J domain-containing protein [Myxococcota bacterium]|nr:J domain-containing protein [Myxococcota bacterium]
MAQAELAPTEIHALARILDELDYYGLLHVAPGASVADVKRAYFASSRCFHPDANRHLPDDLQVAIARIAKRVTEAYSVLRDPRRRAAYDRRLATGGSTRLQLAEAEAEADRSELQQRGQTPQGRQYFARAEADLQRGDTAAALRNLQTALTFEPGNEAYRRKLQELRRRSR